jgi:hypothetical protein
MRRRWTWLGRRKRPSSTGQQIKWLVYATSVVVIGALGAVLLPLPIGDVFYGMMIYGFAGMPVAVGVAILRYRLYDIDILINRTLVYGSLALMLVWCTSGV